MSRGRPSNERASPALSLDNDPPPRLRCDSHDVILDAAAYVPLRADGERRCAGPGASRIGARPGRVQSLHRGGDVSVNPEAPRRGNVVPTPTTGEESIADSWGARIDPAGEPDGNIGANTNP
jgi:hypothetical protein